MGRFCLSFSTFSFFGAGFVGQQAKAKGNVNAHAHRRTVGPRSTVEHGAQRSAHVLGALSLRHSLFLLGLHTHCVDTQRTVLLRRAFIFLANCIAP